MPGEPAPAQGRGQHERQADQAEADPGARHSCGPADQRADDRLAAGQLADLCTMIDPAAIVVDGSLGAAGQFVLAGIRESIDRHAAPVVIDSVRVLHGTLDEDAEPLGGVALARQHRVGSRPPLAGAGEGGAA